MPLKRSQFIDKAPWWVAAAVAIAYVVAFIICCAVGGAGPTSATQTQTVDANRQATNMTCADPTTCVVTWQGNLNGLSGFNQALWMTAEMVRPLDALTNKTRYVLPRSSFSIPITWQTIVVADGTMITNVSNTDTMFCPANTNICGTLFLFTQSFIWNNNYRVTFIFSQPFEGFYEAGIGAASIAPGEIANIRVTSSYVNSDFTHFQLSGKYTFFTLTFVVWVLYLVCLHQSGKGILHPVTRARLPMTDEQNWAAVLGGLCVWYNDPAFAASVTAPTFAATGFYAFCAVSFIVLLLLYWLVHFDAARRLGENHIAGAAGGASEIIIRRYGCSKATAGLVFWIPKLIWCCITWILILAYVLVQRAAWLSNPSANIIAQIPLVNQFFVQFVTAWGVIYVIYLFLLILSNFYNFRVISPSSRSVLVVTVLTISVTLAGFFSDSLVTVNTATGSTIFMASLGGVNIYIWYLMLVVSPLYPHAQADADAADRADAIAEEQRRLGDAEALRKTGGPVPTVDHDTQTDDPEWLHSAMAARSHHQSADAESSASYLHGSGARDPVVGTGAVRVSMTGGGAGGGSVGVDLLAPPAALHGGGGAEHEQEGEGAAVWS